MTGEEQKDRKHGGAREGAGRPKKEEFKYTKTCPVSDARMFVDMAISQLKRIRNDDPNRLTELKRMLDAVKSMIEEIES